VAKTTRTTLAGTLSFTEDSTTVNTTSDQTSVVAADDVIGKDDGTDEGWWKVASVSSSAITLDCPYHGATESGVTGYKMTSEGDYPQTEATDGSSTSSYLKVSGGWNLSNTTREGLTYFHTTSGNTLQIDGDYVEVEYLVMTSTVDYSNVVWVVGVYHYMHHCHVAGDADCGGIQCNDNTKLEYVVHTGLSDSVQYAIDEFNELNYCYAYGGGSHGFDLTTASSFTKLTNCVAKGFDGTGDAGFRFFSCNNVLVKDCTADDCYYGFYPYANPMEIHLINPTATNCGTGIDAGSCYALSTYVYEPTFSGNTNDYDHETSAPYDEPRIAVVDSGVHERKYPFCSIFSDTTDARSGTCIKFDPNSTLTNRQPLIALGTVEVTSTASDLTLKVYMKDDSSFNGTVYLMAIQDGDWVVDPTTKTMTTSYVEQSVVVASADLTLNSYVTLYAVVTGTAGNVFADDFSYSQ
jgi:hypothetical protein